MNKAGLITALADQTGQNKAEVTRTLDALMETIGATLAQGGRLLLVGFGTFDIQHRSARVGRNPQTGVAIEIAEATLPKFSPGKALKDRVAVAHKPKAPPQPAAAEARMPKPKTPPPPLVAADARKPKTKASPQPVAAEAPKPKPPVAAPKPKPKPKATSPS